MKYLILAIFVTITLHSHSQNKKSEFVSPTKEENPKLTGSFAEIRSNHFHSGIDFSTDGAVGVKIYAVADGYVSRVKISSTGYGTALYITHNNGLTSVYGHLNSYSTKIDTIVTAIQYEYKKFDIDYKFDKDRIPVKSGELVALSGNSGFSGGPHLHFELRETESERVVNPFFHILGIQDNIAPKINTIILYPLTPSSTINGKSSSQPFEVVNNKGYLTLKGNPTIKIAGTFGIGVKTYDLLNGSPRKCGIYSISVRENSNSLFYCDLYSFGFDETRYINSLIDYKAKINQDQTIIKAFIEPNNHLSIYKRTSNRGELTVEANQKITIQLEVADASKNNSKLTFNILGVKQIAIKEKPAASNLIKCNTTVTKEINGITFNFLQSSIYSDYLLHCSVSQNNPTYNSPIYSLGDKDVAIHSTVDIKLNTPKHLSKYCKYLTMSRINKEGKLEYVGGKCNKEVISFSINEFGKHIISVDSIAPSITIANSPKDNTYKGRRYIVIKAIDKLSEIGSYEGYVDNKWTLFEYDKKNDQLLCPLAKAPISHNKTHILELKVSDKVGNERKLTAKFKY